jgi:hypothetical protein
MTVAIAAAVLALVSMAFVFSNRSARREEAERAEEYRKAAALRGWQMQWDGAEYRYSGTTEGVAWTARVGHYRRSVNREPRPLRWETTSVRFDGGALVIWPDFGNGPDPIHMPEVPEFVRAASMRLLTNALGVAGENAATLAAATQAVEGPDSYLFRATHPDRMHEWLASGAAKALEAEAGWLATRENRHHLIIAVLWRHGLQLATAYGSNDFDHIERVARAGVKLAEAARTDRFGRVL